MAEDFSTYTEVDPDSVITIASPYTCVVFDGLCGTFPDHDPSYVDKALASAITGDYKHEFSFKIDAVHSEDITYDNVIVYGLSNTLSGTFYELYNGESAFVTAKYNHDYLGQATLFITLYVNDHTTWRDYVTLTIPYILGTTLFVTVERDDDGGVNSLGLYTITVCTDTFLSEGGTPTYQATITVPSAGTGGTQIDFANIYALAIYDTSTFQGDGSICSFNLSVGETFFPKVIFI